MNTKRKKCPLCESGDTGFMFMKDGIAFRSCRVCGLRFCLPQGNPNLDRSTDGYEKAYLQYLEPNSADPANHLALLNWMKRGGCLSGKKILDVGCGSGKWVRFLQRHGYDASGIEPSKTLYENYLSDESAFSFATAEELIQTYGEKFDIVTAFDVLEHTPNPGIFLRSVTKLVKPAGTIFLSTPDTAGLAAVAMGKFWYHYYECHLCCFTKKTLTRLADELGLKVKYLAHRPKQFPVGYLFRYAREFILRSTASQEETALDRVTIPLNFFDIMYARLEKT